LNGYKVEIEGDETYSFLPPRINGFRSAVYTIGGKGCSNFNLFSGLRRKAFQPQIHRLANTNINNNSPGALCLALVNCTGLGIISFHYHLWIDWIYS
jgi:hypothetical protein